MILHIFPSLSSSLGQSAIFLIGGQSRQQKPLPLLLRSGDVVVMAGKSRTAYHAVPHVLPCEGESIPRCLSKFSLKQAMSEREPNWLHCRVCGYDLEECSDRFGLPVARKDMAKCTASSGCRCLQLEGSWAEFEDYLTCSRININTRQVGNLTQT